MLALAEVAYWKMRMELLVAGQGWQMHRELGRAKQRARQWRLEPKSRAGQ